MFNSENHYTSHTSCLESIDIYTKLIFEGYDIVKLRFKNIHQPFITTILSSKCWAKRYNYTKRLPNHAHPNYFL